MCKTQWSKWLTSQTCSTPVTETWNKKSFQSEFPMSVERKMMMQWRKFLPWLGEVGQTCHSMMKPTYNVRSKVFRMVDLPLLISLSMLIEGRSQLCHLATVFNSAFYVSRRTHVNRIICRELSGHSFLLVTFWGWRSCWQVTGLCSFIYMPCDLRILVFARHEVLAKTFLKYSHKLSS